MKNGLERQAEIYLGGARGQKSQAPADGNRLELLDAGLTPGEIARRLLIPAPTVKSWKRLRDRVAA